MDSDNTRKISEQHKNDRKIFSDTPNQQNNFSTQKTTKMIKKSEKHSYLLQKASTEPESIVNGFNEFSKNSTHANMEKVSENFSKNKTNFSTSKKNIFQSSMSENSQNQPYLPQNIPNEAENNRNGILDISKNLEQYPETIQVPSTDNSPRKSTIKNSTSTSETEIDERENTYKGDKLSHKKQNTTRIYCQNVNGLDIGRGGGDINSLCIDMKRTQTDILLATGTRVCHRHTKI